MKANYNFFKLIAHFVCFLMLCFSCSDTSKKENDADKYANSLIDWKHITIDTTFVGDEQLQASPILHIKASLIYSLENETDVAALVKNINEGIGYQFFHIQKDTFSSVYKRIHGFLNETAERKLSAKTSYFSTIIESGMKIPEEDLEATLYVNDSIAYNDKNLVSLVQVTTSKHDETNKTYTEIETYNFNILDGNNIVNDSLFIVDSKDKLFGCLAKKLAENEISIPVESLKNNPLHYTFTDNGLCFLFTRKDLGLNADEEILYSVPLDFEDMNHVLNNKTELVKHLRDE